ncbi:uncharacterized protein LACBIDRAFT_336341, partial [Laccaria bicolor S238N-H82]
TERKIRLAALHWKRLETLKTNKFCATEKRALDEMESAAQGAREKEADQMRHVGVFNKVLAILQENQCTLAEFLDYTFNPSISHVFDWRCIARLTQNLRSLAPTFFSIADAFSTTSRQEKSLSKGWAEKKNICLKVRLGPVIGCPGALTETETGLVITGYLTMEGSAILTLLKARSQKNNYAQAIHSTYLMATGAQCQHFTVFTSLGIGISYPSVITQLPKENKGTACKVTATGLFVSYYVSTCASTLGVATFDASEASASSSSFCSAANNVPSLGTKLRRRLAWYRPSRGVPSKVSSLYEFRRRSATRCGEDHMGASLRSVLRVDASLLSYTCTS